MNEEQELLKEAVKAFMDEERIVIPEDSPLRRILISAFSKEWFANRNKDMGYTEVVYSTISSSCSHLILYNHRTKGFMIVSMFMDDSGLPSRIDVMGHCPVAVEMARAICDRYLEKKRNI